MRIIGLAFYCVSAMVQADVCSDLSNVANEVGNGFSDWRGAYDSDLDEYAATYLLPGAGECTVVAGEFPEYACAWELPDSNQMKSQYQGLLSEISSCTNLFPGNVRVRAYQHAANSTRYYRYQPAETSKFTSVNAPFEVSVRTRSSTRITTGQQRYSIKVVVSAK